MIQKLRIAHAFPCLALLALAGCGPGSGSISGKVTYKDQPLTGGTVTFVSSDQKVRTGVISSDGTYTVEKVTVGPAKVAVSPPIPITPMGPPGGKKMDPSKMGGGPDGAGPSTSTDKPVSIPDRYKDPEKSGLTHTVTSGKQEFNIPLK